MLPTEKYFSMGILKEKKILLISPEAWDDLPVSKHHYAEVLAKKDNEVFFLEPPKKRYGWKYSSVPQLSVLQYPGFPKGFRFFPRFIQKLWTKKVFQKLERLANSSFDIIWSFDNSVFFETTALSYGVLKISHIVDLNQDFQTARVASNADICFGTTSFITKRLASYNSRIYRLGHAVISQIDGSNSSSLPGSNSVKAAYGGNLAIPYLDRSLLEDVVVQNPEVDFILFGPNAGELKQIPGIGGRENVYFPGKVEPRTLSAYYRRADLLLVLYKEGYEEQVADPHKMLEYLASGKCVVATWTESYKDLDGDLLRMAKHNNEFPDLLKDTVEKLEYYNSPELMKRRRGYVKDFTYEKRIEEIEEYLAPIMQEKGLLS